MSGKRQSKASESYMLLMLVIIIAIILYGIFFHEKKKDLDYDSEPRHYAHNEYILQKPE